MSLECVLIRILVSVGGKLSFLLGSDWTEGIIVCLFLILLIINWLLFTCRLLGGYEWS